MLDNSGTSQDFKSGHFKIRAIKRMQPVFKNRSSLSELMENNDDGDVS